MGFASVMRCLPQGSSYRGDLVLHSQRNSVVGVENLPPQDTPRFVHLVGPQWHSVRETDCRNRGLADFPSPTHWELDPDQKKQSYSEVDSSSMRNQLNRYQTRNRTQPFQKGANGLLTDIHFAVAFPSCRSHLTIRQVPPIEATVKSKGSTCPFEPTLIGEAPSAPVIRISRDCPSSA